eukprot:superscaffoldBa00004155_g18367
MELSKWWFLLLLCALVLLCEDLELLPQLVDLSCSFVHDVRQCLPRIGATLSACWLGAMSPAPFGLLYLVMERLVLGGAGYCGVIPGWAPPASHQGQTLCAALSDPVRCTVGSCTKHFILV